MEAHCKKLNTTKTGMILEERSDPQMKIQFWGATYHSHLSPEQWSKEKLMPKIHDPWN